MVCSGEKYIDVGISCDLVYNPLDFYPHTNSSIGIVWGFMLNFA